MLWYSAPGAACIQEDEKDSVLCYTRVYLGKGEQNFSYQVPEGDKSITKYIPNGVRVSDDFLGACWLDTTAKLQDFFSAGVYPDDQFPFSDRKCWGRAYRPHLEYLDYPGPFGDMADRRIGYIVCPDKKVVVLGGDDFSLKDMRNFSGRIFTCILLTSLTVTEDSYAPFGTSPSSTLFEMDREFRIAQILRSCAILDQEIMLDLMSATTDSGLRTNQDPRLHSPRMPRLSQLPQ